jgi:putative oxidoreductase
MLKKSIIKLTLRGNCCDLKALVLLAGYKGGCMSFVKRGNRYAEDHPFMLFTVLRVVLGLILLIHGIYFIQNTETVIAMLHAARLEFGAVALSHYIALVHIAGGILIAIGMITRVSILFQLPILIGAVFVGFGPLGVVTHVLIAIPTLLLALFFLFYGSGVHSVNAVTNEERDRLERVYRE